MSALFIVILYRLYLLGLFIFAMNALARAIFGELKLKFIPRTIFAAFFWPMFLFSQRGRKKLLGKINKL